MSPSAVTSPGRTLVLVSGIALILWAAACMGGALGCQPGASADKLVLMTTGVFLVLTSLLLARTLQSGIVRGLTVAFFAYLLCDVVVSLLYAAHVVEPRYAETAIEDTARTIRFDPVLGFALTGPPSRTARVTDGTLEYLGLYKGNNLGFQDRDDVFPQRDDEDQRRLLVFGDSFSSAEFLQCNWPDRVEDLAPRGTLRLLNFSLTGGGIANWWSTLTQIVEPEHYEVDGIIFAVFPSDLRRKFAYAHGGDPGQDQLLFARAASWDPQSHPADLQSARARMVPMLGRFLPPPEFQRFLEGEWTPPFGQGRTRFYLASRLWKAFEPAPPAFVPPPPFTGFDAGRQALISDIKRVAGTLGVPLLVVHLPERAELLGNAKDAARFEATLAVDIAEARDFAEQLGATFVDGKLAFAGSTAEEIRAMWLPYDRHWGQAGSDRFARFMSDVLATWP